MFIDTTVSLKEEILRKLKNASVLMGISRTELISQLLSKVYEKNNFEVKIFSRVKYQKSATDSKYRRLHVFYRKDVYECCLDMRKLFKVSVSFIIAYAVSKYLNELVNSIIKGKNKKITDNYRKDYCFISKLLNGMFTFTIFWGFPEEETIIKTLGSQ